ncbi:hypothetical protein AAF712_015478 [Marasmius tenuissimus]|uniref:NAD(P)-binding protein n=1 Tax=Marasmius tenuissimus TaxID=585030 RepID=A0ABR2ZAF3_9AGAR
MSPLVWLITGTSTGLGRDLAIAALNRGDKVIATARARSISQIDDLRAKGAETIELDVTASLENLQDVAKKVVSFYGRVDVLVNNAGYILVGAIEESTYVRLLNNIANLSDYELNFIMHPSRPEETYNQFNTNVFGALNVTRVFLPYMRERKTGTVVFMGSLGGWSAGPSVGLYVTTKWALRGISQSLHTEIAPLGLRSLCLDFGYFRTSFLSSDHRQPYIARIPDYQELTEKSEAALQAYNGKQPGDPKKAVQVLLDIVHGDGLAQGKPFPTSVQFGSDCYSVAKEHCETALANLEEWKEVSFSANFPEGT